MTEDDIIRMAREAGWDTGDSLDDCATCSRFDLKDFANLVAAAEREACASICFQEAPSIDGELIAAAIRARGEK